MLVNIPTSPNVFILLSSFFCSEVDKSTHFIRAEKHPDMHAAWLRSRTKPGYVRSLSYDPVKFGQECGRANLLLLSAQFQRLFASMSTSELLAHHDVLRCLKSEAGEMARLTASRMACQPK